METKQWVIVLMLSPLIYWLLMYALCFVIMIVTFITCNVYRWARKVKAKVQQPDSHQQQHQSNAAQ